MAKYHSHSFELPPTIAQQHIHEKDELLAEE